MFEKLVKRHFEVRTLHHAEAILRHDLRRAVRELEDVLLSISIPIEEIIRGGGGESSVTQRMRRSLAETHDWEKHNFEIKKTVDGKERESLSHEIDHVRRLPGGVVALEIEWNNKDPFFDRDLENFKRLHGEGAISIGVVITRGSTLQESLKGFVKDFALRHKLRVTDDLAQYYVPTPRQKRLIAKAAASRGSFAAGWAHAFVADKFGEATTHWRKLDERVNRGVGNPCPLLLIGLPREVVKT